MKRIHCAALLCAISFLPPLAAPAVTIDTVPVGNPGNADDVWNYGAVDYSYRMGTYEVTNSQYAEFLNAKAKSDPLGLYKSSVEFFEPPNAITRSNASGNYLYEVRPNMGNKPVAWVSLFDAMRFANWMQNGQGNGDTESGAYTLEGGTRTPSNAGTITRNPNAVWVLPTRDEWIKAAFYDPRTEAGGGPPLDDNYWLFATQSNSTPTIATANSVGDINNPGANVANYDGGAEWNVERYNYTTVGSAGPLSASFYGTHDQSGNAGEWTTLADEIYSYAAGSGLDGPAIFVSGILPPTPVDGTDEGYGLGFRLAMVPEPSALWLAAMGLACMLLAGRRKRRV